MANYISDPILAAVGIADGVLAKTKELIGTVVGRRSVSEEEDSETLVQHDAGQED